MGKGKRFEKVEYFCLEFTDWQFTSLFFLLLLSGLENSQFFGFDPQSIEHLQIDLLISTEVTQR